LRRQETPGGASQKYKRTGTRPTISANRQNKADRPERNDDMSLVQYAKSELERAGMFSKDSDYNGMLGDAVLKLVEVFAAQGHSGASASMTVALFRRVAMFEILSPLTGKDDEWNEIGEGVFQNKRASNVFKKGEGKAYCGDAITWKNEKGFCYTGTADGMRSRQYIPAFPFTPRNFVIDVTEEEIGKDDFEFHIKNPEDLEKVWAVYERPSKQKG
jgi:hypothetical protein